MRDPWLEGIVQKQAMEDKPTLGGQIPDHALEILTARKRIAELGRENYELRERVRVVEEALACARASLAIASEKENERG